MNATGSARSDPALGAPLPRGVCVVTVSPVFLMEGPDQLPSGHYGAGSRVDPFLHQRTTNAEHTHKPEPP